MARLEILSAPTSDQEGSKTTSVQRIPLTRDTLVLGRDAACDVVLADLSISRRHAQIVGEGGTYKIRDLQSKNAIHINGERLTTDQVLKDRDKITLGSISLIFYEERPALETTSFLSLDDEEAPPPAYTTLELPLTRTSAPPSASMPVYGRRLEAAPVQLVSEVSQLLQTQQPFSERLENVLHCVTADLRADAAQIYILDKDTQRLKLLTQVGQSLFINKISKTIIRYVMKTGKAVITSDATQDERFLGSQSIVQKAIHSVICIPLVAVNKTWGVLYFYKEAQKGGFDKPVFETLSIISLISAAYVAYTVSEIEGERRFFSLMTALIKAVERKNPDTRGHAERVASFSLVMGEEMGLSKETLKLLYMAALVHDLGKLSLPPEKPEDRLQPAWWNAHIRESEALLEETVDKEAIWSIIRFHHWRLDGSGAPDDASSKDVSIPARILAVANTLDHLLTFGLPDGRALQTRDAILYLKLDGGKQYDPSVVEALLRAYEKNRLYHLYLWPELPFAGLNL